MMRGLLLCRVLLRRLWLGGLCSFSVRTSFVGGGIPSGGVHRIRGSKNQECQ
jgi:hypothetical protein